MQKQIQDGYIIKKKAVSGVFWQTFSNVLQFPINFAVLIVIARLLSPKEFGVVALASSIIIFFSALSSWGTSNILIQKKNLTSEFIDTFFTLQIVISVLIFILIIAGRFIFFKFYELAVVNSLTFLGLIFIFETVQIIPKCLLQKELILKADAILRLVATIISSLIVIVVAYLGMSYWSLVIFRGSEVLVLFIGYFVLCSHKFKILIDRESFKFFFIKGKSYFAGENLIRFNHNFDDYLLGTLKGSRTLGLYSMSYRFSEILSNIISPAVDSSAFPTYSKFQDDRAKLSQSYSMIISSLFRLSLLFYLPVGLLIYELVNLIYGPKWVEISNVFRMLIPYGIFISIARNSMILFNSKNDPERVLKINLIQALILAPLLFIFIKFFGVSGVAIAVDIMIIAAVVLYFIYAQKYVDLNLVKIFVPPLIASIISIGISYPLYEYLSPFLDDIFKILIFGVLSAGIFLFVLFLMERRELKLIYGLLLSVFKKG